MDSRTKSFGDRIAEDVPFRGPIRFVVSSRFSIPLSFGIFTPVIVLPADSEGWPDDRLFSVLAHEIAHVCRYDVLIQSAAYLVCALFWFAPPLWLAYAALLREAETCCDQRVIDRGVYAPEYARTIVELARLAGGRTLLPPTSASLDLKALVTNRITRLLALKPSHRPFGLIDAAKVMLVCFCCMAPVLAVFGNARIQLSARDDIGPGTWVNPDYDASQRFTAAKYIGMPDGHLFCYRHIADTKPFTECWDTVEKRWTDSQGRHWQRSRQVSRNSECFVLSRISADGRTMEWVVAQDAYPKDISPLGPSYGVAYRQR